MEIGEQWASSIVRESSSFPRYDAAWGFNDGIALVRIVSPAGQGPSLFGFVSKDGDEIIPPRFIRATNFSEGLAFARARDQRLLTMIDSAGQAVGDAKYEDAAEFSEGLAAVRVGGEWGYVERAGRWAIPPRFERADSFRSGLARVSWKGGRGYIDKSGKEIWKAPSVSPSR